MSGEDSTASAQATGPADTAPEDGSPKKTGGRLALWVSAGLFCLYLLNVLSGKLATISEVKLPINLGDVGEFVTLFAAAICFVIATLQREAAD